MDPPAEPAPPPPVAPPTTGPDGSATPDQGSDPDSSERARPDLVANDNGEDHDPGGINLGTGLFVVSGLGAVALGAMLLARRGDAADQAGATSPGASGRATGGVAPVVRELGNAYQQRASIRPSGFPGHPYPGSSVPPPRETPHHAYPTSPAAGRGGGGRTRLVLPLGTAPDGSPARVDLAAAPELALNGDNDLPGLARGVLLTCLTPPTGHGVPRAHVVMTTADATHLLGDLHDQPHPPELHIVDDIDAALDALDTWAAPAPVVFLATAPRPDTPTADRLHRILTTRHPHTIAAILLGAWPGPAQIHAGPDATVRACIGLSHLASGSRLFTAPQPDARDLLATLTTPASTHPDATHATAGHDHDAPADGDRDAVPGTAFADHPGDEHIDTTDLLDEAANDISAPSTTNTGRDTIPDRLHDLQLPDPPPESSDSDDTTAGDGHNGDHDSEDDSEDDSDNGDGNGGSTDDESGEGGDGDLTAAAPAISSIVDSRPRSDSPADTGGPADPRGNRTATEAKRAPEPAPKPTARPQIRAPHEANAETGVHRLAIDVFGRLQVRTNPHAGPSVDIAGSLSDRRRELLIYLATHPDGARRGLITADLWATSPVKDPAGLLHSAIFRLRSALAPHIDDTPVIIGPEDDHYRLHPDLDVDYWRFETASTTHRTAQSDTDRAAAAHQIITIHHADLAPALTTDWIEPLRAHATRTAIDAADYLARHHYHNNETDHAIGVLEQAITTIDPHAESLYQLLIQLQRKQGRPKAAARTLDALKARLASIGLAPSPATIALVR